MRKDIIIQPVTFLMKNLIPYAKVMEKSNVEIVACLKIIQIIIHHILKK